MRCLIIGGGVIGLTIAYRLAQRKIEVTLLERGRLGREASWAGAGIIPPANQLDAAHPLEQLQALSFRLHRDLSNELLQETGIDNQYHRCGGLYLASTAGESAALTGACQAWKEENIACQRLTPDELIQTESALTQFAKSKLKSAVLLPDECQLRNPRHLKALISACKKQNVTIREESPVHDVSFSSDRVELQLVEGKKLEGDVVCYAAGAWTSSLMQNINPPLTIDQKIDVVPIKGHMLLFKLPQPIFSHILNEGNRYLVPRRDGHVLAGSTEEETGFDQSTSESEIAELLKFARDRIDDLNSETLVRSWTGLRPMSFDQVPYIGQHSEESKLYVATGHYRSGLQLSSGTGRIMTQLICGETPDIDVALLRPGR